MTGVTAAPTTVDPASQQIRVAVVLNGGVSLAVWMSGVAHELNRLVQGSRRRATGTGVPDAYADLLGVLGAEARIDVIAGTSAGGINGGFLALGLVQGADLTGLRNLWQQAGALDTLLRNPRAADQPSLLRGDYFHRELAKAYKLVQPDPGSVPAADGEDVDLFLTGTLWEGRRSFFADDMGRRITERDYDATFHFTSDPDVLGGTPESRKRGNLRSDTVTDELAVASRCTASFPAAFEPFPVKLDGKENPPDPDAVPLADGRWPSDAGRANFRPSQFVIDGGILRNKPIRPAIDAVYRQPADQQVRRVLTYVVPDPGEPATGPGKPAVADVPNAADVMLGVLTRLRSTDSVADELAEIRRRNEETTHRRRSRDRLAATLVDAAAAQCAEALVAAAYPGYLEVRREDTANSVARLLTTTRQPHHWSQAEIATELRIVLEDPQLPFIPQANVENALAAEGAEWRWGQATVRRLGDLVLDVLKRAVWLAPLADDRRTAIVGQRASAHRVLEDVRADREVLDAYWRAATLTDGDPGVPERTGSPSDKAASPAELRSLRERLRGLAGSWNDAGRTEPMTSLLHRRAEALAACLHDAGDVLHGIARGDRSAVDPGGDEQQRLRSLVDLLMPDGASAADVLRNMLRLEILHVAFTGVSDVAEQGVELVQVSSLREDLVTGVQLHHFGAFYRESWRVNDWLRGRLDGSEQLIEMLLAPERLRQLGVLTAQQALDLLKPVAVGPPGTARNLQLTDAWDAVLPQLTEELQVLQGTGPLPRTFPHTAARIAQRIRAELLPDELACLAEAVVKETDPVRPAVDWADRIAADLHGHENAKVQPGVVELDTMLRGSEVVGRQTIAAEGARGSDTFALTVTHAAATLTATTASLKKPKAAVSLVKGLRGYAMLLWVLVAYTAGGSNVGRALVTLAVGVGGALVALGLLVPGVPAILPVTGAVLILAAASAAALRSGKSTGWGLAVRIVLITVLVLAVLAALLYQRANAADQSLWQTAKDIALPTLVVVLLVGLGWFVGHPSKGKA